jgi:hypothetical protein
MRFVLRILITAAAVITASPGPGWGAVLAGG